MMSEVEDRRPEIQVNCRFFAAYRDSAGTEELVLRVPEGSTVADLVGLLRERSGFASLPARPAVAVGQEYATGDRVLSDGDEVAFIPPVAGG